MPVIQPYFDPTIRRTRNVFTSFLSSFMKVRSEANEMLMKHALQQQSPEFLAKQMELINNNINTLRDQNIDIIELETEKAKAIDRYNLAGIKAAQVKPRRSGGGGAARTNETAALRAKLKAEETMRLFDDDSFETDLVKRMNILLPTEGVKAKDLPNNFSDFSSGGGAGWDIATANREGTTTATQAINDVFESSFRTWLGSKGHNLTDPQIKEIAKMARSKEKVGGGSESTWDPDKVSQMIYDAEMRSHIPARSYSAPPRKAVPFDQDRAGNQAAHWDKVISDAVASNALLAGDIKAYETQKGKIREEYDALNENFDPYSEFAPRGISNTMLHSPFIQSKKPARKVSRGAPAPMPSRHTMKDPKTGNKVVVENQEEHEKLVEEGYVAELTLEDQELIEMAPIPSANKEVRKKEIPFIPPKSGGANPPRSIGSFTKDDLVLMDFVPSKWNETKPESKLATKFTPKKKKNNISLDDDTGYDVMGRDSDDPRDLIGYEEGYDPTNNTITSSDGVYETDPDYSNFPQYRRVDVEQLGKALNIVLPDEGITNEYMNELISSVKNTDYNASVSAMERQDLALLSKFQDDMKSNLDFDQIVISDRTRTGNKLTPFIIKKEG